MRGVRVRRLVAIAGVSGGIEVGIGGCDGAGEGSGGNEVMKGVGEMVLASRAARCDDVVWEK